MTGFVLLLIAYLAVLTVGAYLAEEHPRPVERLGRVLRFWEGEVENPEAPHDGLTVSAKSADFTAVCRHVYGVTTSASPITLTFRGLVSGVTTSASLITVTLPAASAGCEIVVKNVDGTSVIVGAGSELIVCESEED